MNSKIILISLLLAFLSNCGFKIVKQDFLNNYKINKIDINGEKQTSFLLKNKFKNQNNNAPKSIDLLIDLKKSKNIKEKNIRNEITKYEVKILVDVEYKLDEEKIYGEINIEKKGNYSVSSHYSNTISNEKRLIRDLVDDISNQILKELKIRFNDL